MVRYMPGTPVVLVLVLVLEQVVVVVVVNRDPRLRLARFTVLAGYRGDPPHTPRGLVDGDDARSTTTVALAT